MVRVLLREVTEEGSDGRRRTRRLTRAARFADDSTAAPAASRPAHDPSRQRRDRGPFVLPASLTVSIVTHHPDLALLERCLRRLAAAIGAARAARSARQRRRGAHRQQRGPRRRRQRQRARPGLPSRQPASRLRSCTGTPTSATAPRTTWCCTAPAPITSSCSIRTSSSRPTRIANAMRWLDAQPRDRRAWRPRSPMPTARRCTCASAIRPCSTSRCAASRRAFVALAVPPAARALRDARPDRPGERRAGARTFR